MPGLSERRTANARLFSDSQYSNGSDLRHYRSALGPLNRSQTDKFLSDFSNSLPLPVDDGGAVRLRRGKSGYQMNADYEDYASNDLVRLFMDSLDDASRFVSVEQPEDNNEWKLLHRAGKKEPFWSWRRQTDNQSVLHSKCIFLFKNVSPTHLFECLQSDKRGEWDSQTDFEVLDIQPEYELIYQKQTKIPYSMQRDMLYHNLSRRSFFVCDGKPDVHVIVRQSVDSDDCPEDPYNYVRAKIALQAFLVEAEPKIRGARLTTMTNMDFVDSNSVIMTKIAERAPAALYQKLSDHLSSKHDRKLSMVIEETKSAMQRGSIDTLEEKKNL